MSTLQDQVAVVTGASSGIGRAIAEALARKGARLCLVGRNLDSLRQVASKIGPSEASCCYRCDLERSADIDALVSNLKNDAPRVHILIHAAGVMWWGPIESITASQLDSTYKTNVRAPCLLNHGLAQQLKAASGQVVFLNSTAGLTGKANVGQYAASKHALKALADSLREEVNPAGVRVLSIFLGRTASAMQAGVHASEGRAYRPELLLQPGDIADVVVHALERPRTMEVTDITLRPLVKSY